MGTNINPRDVEKVLRAAAAIAALAAAVAVMCHILTIAKHTAIIIHNISGLPL